MASMTCPLIRVLCGLLLAAAVFPTSAWAQTATNRPWRGLFGSEEGPRRPHRVSAFASVFGGYDDNKFRDLGGVVVGINRDERRFFSRGVLTGGNFGIGYSGEFGPVSVSANAGAGIRYYPDQNLTLIVPSHSAGAATGFAHDLSPRTRLVFNQSAAYHPYYSLVAVEPPPLEGPVPPPATEEDFAIAQRASVLTSTRGGLEHRITEATSLNASYGFDLRHFFTDEAQDYFGSSYVHRIRGGLSHRISRDATLHAGYGYRLSYYGNRTDPLPLHEIDAGIDYSRSLSFSRRTSFSFRTGTSAVVRDPDNPVDQPRDDRSLRFRLNGAAQLRHEIGRTWAAAATYSRGVSFMDGFPEPFSHDTFTAGIGGLLARRVSAQASASYSHGFIGYAPGDTDYGTFHASVGLSSALNRFMAAYANVFYYDYGFGADVQLPELVLRDQERFGARIGLTAWLPIWP